MPDSGAIREVFGRAFDAIEEVGEHVLRGERRYNGKPFAVAYMDTSDNIAERATKLSGFQEQLLGPEYFDAGSDLRWNSYLYFWAGPRSTAQNGYAQAKAVIERDRHYARKFVVTSEDLANRLRRASAPSSSGLSVADASRTWSEILRAAALGAILEQDHRTRVLDQVASGDIFAVADQASASASRNVRTDELQTGRLRSLSVGTFRPALAGREFAIGDVTLIYGPNGSGKTSLLEAVEALYCGRVRRDQDAACDTIKAEILTGAGRLVPIQTRTDPSTLKARNLLWYGRSDPQSQAILQGFSRFNFLDTDAAFRMSSSTDKDEIKADLGRLLVGPEAAKLWTYLSKLEEDAKTRSKELNGRVLVLSGQVDGVERELTRLRNVPSESQSLARGYNARLAELGAQWRHVGEPQELISGDRAHLESAERSIAQAVSTTKVTVPTLQALRERSESLVQLASEARALAMSHAQASTELASGEQDAYQLRGDLGVLETWSKYCEAGAPAVAVRLKSLAADVAECRASLGEHALEQVSDLPQEYDGVALSSARHVAVSRVKEAEENERAAAQRLQESERLGATLATLRKDLYEVAQGLIQKTGDSLHCPVCRTEHTSTDLARKLQALVDLEENERSAGHRGAVRVASQRAEDERRILLQLNALDAYRTRSGASEAMTTAEAREDLRRRQAQLTDLTQTQERLQETANGLVQLGLSWDSYEAAQLSAMGLLDGDRLADLAVVRSEMNTTQGRVVNAVQAAGKARESMTDCRERLGQFLQRADIHTGANWTPTDVVTEVERAQIHADAAVAAIVDAQRKIRIKEMQSLEEVRVALNDALLSLDRAMHAQKNEAQSRADLNIKTRELDVLRKELADCTREQENFGRVLSVLKSIVQDHSLDKATKETLEVIRQRVSDVFARIHSPHEYEVGSLAGESLLRTLDGGQTRRVSQVSTGQRAALALSVFLALNGSAHSVPPVVLIDDPIAHIDDLNALSFLDYLRDLILSTDRQVLFATADGRLAALFERKFEFLGDERFRKVVLSR